MKTFCGLKCSVTPHKSLNTSKGIVRCPTSIRQSNEHILEFMEEQGVTDVPRINVHRDGVLIQIIHLYLHLIHQNYQRLSK